MKIDPTVGKYVFSALIVSSMALIFTNYYMKTTQKTDNIEFDLIQQYLVNKSSLAKSDKPILWIHNEYKLNDRNWLSFGSRNTNELNKPIIYLTIDTIIKKCDKSFNICLIDDNSFKNLIPGWNIDLDTVPEPNKKKYRLLAMLHLIYIYGGLHIPSSLLCFKNLESIFTKYTSPDTFVVSEGKPNSIISEHSCYFPSFNIFGGIKNNHNLLQLIKILENKIMKNLNSEMEFKGSLEKELLSFIDDNKCNIIPGKILGYYDNNNKPISIQMLMSDEEIKLSNNNIAINIPIDEIINSKNFDWFSKLTLDELPKVNNNIGYLLNKLYCN